MSVVDRFDDWLGEEMSPRRAAVVYAILFAYYGVLLTPLVWMVLSTLNPSDAIFSGDVLRILSPANFSLENYATVVNLGEFRQFFVNSVVIATGTTALTMFCSIPGGYALSRFDFPGKHAAIVGFLSTQMVPRVLILIPFFLSMYTLSLVDTYLGIVLAHTVLALPLVIWMVKGFMDDIPRELDDAARMDGCSHVDIMLRIVLPLSLPGITVGAFYSFVVSWNDYLFVSILSQSTSTRTLPFALQLFQSANRVDWGLVITAATLTLLPVVFLFAFVQNKLVEGFAGGGMKGN